MVGLTQLRTCPLCDSPARLSDPEVRARRPAEQMDDGTLREFFIGFRQEQCFFTYHRCGICGLLWNPVYFSQAALDELYSSMPENTAVSGERDSARTQAAYARRAARSSRPIASVLDIGADIGLFGSAILSRNPSAKITAVEPNVAVHDALRQSIQSDDIASSVSSLNGGATFEVISGIHVLDHLLHPGELLDQLAPRLSGHVYFVVHDESSLLRRTLGKRWPPFCLQHPQLFNRKTLKKLLARHALELVDARKTSNWLSLQQSATLASSLGIVPMSLAGKLPDVSFPLRLGNIDVRAVREKTRKVGWESV